MQKINAKQNIKSLNRDGNGGSFVLSISEPGAKGMKN